MPDTRTQSRDADLAVLKSRNELVYAHIANNPKIASNPLVVAALAYQKACYAAFLTAMADVDVNKNFFRVWSVHRHFTQACSTADNAMAALGRAIEIAEGKIEAEAF